MPAQVAVETSSLPDSEFQPCAKFDVSFKHVVQSCQGKVNEACLVLELGQHVQTQRFLRLRLLGHQPSKANSHPTKSDLGIVLLLLQLPFITDVSS